jgi:hypothetical protein
MKKRKCLVCFKNEGLKHLDHMCLPCFKRTLKCELLEDDIAEILNFENELKAFSEIQCACEA